MTTAGIDIVIPWSGNDCAIAPVTADFAARQTDNGELGYCLSSIQLFAPWVRKIFVLVNDPAATPITLPEPRKTIFVDRTQFLAGQKTTNGLVAETLAWKIPEVSEFFILAHDDTWLGRPTEPSTFFLDGRPYYWHIDPVWGPFRGQGFHDIYVQNPVDCPQPKTSAPTPHFWMPARKSHCARLEADFPAWFSFMRTHLTDRFSSVEKSDAAWTGLEEDFKGVYAWFLAHHNLGVDRAVEKIRGLLYYEFAFVELKGAEYDTQMRADKKFWIPAAESLGNFQRSLNRLGGPLFVNVNTVVSAVTVKKIWSMLSCAHAHLLR